MTSIVIRDDQSRAKAHKLVDYAPVGYEIVSQEAKKSREAERRYHAMLNDIAKQCRHLNDSLDLETWKRLAVDQFRRDTLDDPEIGEYWKGKGLRIVPSLDGSCVVVLGEQTRKFPKRVACAFTEWLFAFGAERGVSWSDPTALPVEAYTEDVRRYA